MFYYPIGLKNCPFYEKSTFFEKKSGKNLVVSKKCSTFAPSNKQTFTTMKKRNIFRTAWAVVSLALIALVCYWWHKQGCGVWSLVAAISFYGVLSAGLMIAVEDMIERR